MFKGLTKGKIIASAVAIAICGFVWGMAFPKGGSGANILLGLFVAFFFLYYFSIYLGGLIDQEIFPGGLRVRARLYRNLDKLLEESKLLVANIKKSKRRRKKLGQRALDALEQTMIQGILVLNKVRDNWHADEATQRDHIKMLTEAADRIEKASRAVFSLGRSWRFLYGIPSLIVALLLALLLRECVVEPYQIPSGSMIPTLLVGDHLFVSKFYYGLSKPFASDPDFLVQWRKPQPGDVVIFKAPDYVGRNAGQAWIKRVIATEGQSIRIVDNTVIVDDQPYTQIVPKTLVTYMDYFGFGGPTSGVWKEQQAWRTVEKIGNIEHQIYLSPYSASRKLGPYWPTPEDATNPGLICDEHACKVDKGYVFVMGDNRGNSADSRIWGALPVSRIKGRAWFIWMSVDGSGQSIEIGPFNLPRFRFDRWFTMIK